MFDSAKLSRWSGVFLVYQIVALVFFGPRLLFHFSDFHAGSGPDPQFMLWSVAWWPYALSHHINPLFTKLVWAPAGFDVVWSTSINLQSIAATPLTLRWGPVVSLNLMALTMPALSALSGFILAYRLVKKSGPALLGGYLYGFSPFMVGHQAGAHVVLTSAFIIPAIILLTLNRLDGEIGARKFVSLVAVLVICQFLMSLELFGTFGFFGIIALFVAWIFWPKRRASLQSTMALMAVAMLLAALVLAPMLVHVFSVSGLGRRRVWTDNGTDLLELIVPGKFFLIGTLFSHQSQAMHQHFTRDVGGYVGLPLILVAICFLRSRFGKRRAYFLAVMLAIVYIAALGPSLHFRGIELCPMPWKLFGKLPLINSAQASRFTIYLHLILALVATLWFAETKLGTPAKLAIASVIVLSILPNVLDQSLWATSLETPGFFTTQQVRNNLRPGETVILLPYSSNGQPMTWQALSGMYFAMAEGAGNGPTPDSFASWPILDVFNYGVDIPEAGQQLLAFMAVHRVTAVIIDRQNPLAAKWLVLMDPATTQIQKIDGVIVARPSADILARYVNATPEQMQCRRDDLRFSALLSAAAEYLHSDSPLARLTPLVAQGRKLLPDNWVNEADSGAISRTGLQLGPWQGDRTIVGVHTADGCARSLEERYRLYSDQVFFPYPHGLGEKRAAPGSQGQFAMVFSQPGLVAEMVREKPFLIRTTNGLSKGDGASIYQSRR